MTLRTIGLRGILLFYFCLNSCFPEVQIQARAANEIAIVANRILPRLLDVYRDAGLRRIREAPDRATAERSLQELRTQWQPLWGNCADGICRGGAWEGLRQAHDAWALYLERQIQGQPIPERDAEAMNRRLEQTFCALRVSVPEGSRGMIPTIPGVTCRE